MTEDEAKTKWCPMGQRPIIAGGGYTIHTHCIGSQCMMWQKIRMPQDYPAHKITYDGQELRSQQIDIVDYGGYCGLAGNP